MRMMNRETMSVMTRASDGDDVLSGADPETLMRHRRIQAQRPTAIVVEPVPDEPKQSKPRRGLSHTPVCRL